MQSKFVILGLLFLGWGLGNFDRFVINYAIVDISKDLSLSATHTGYCIEYIFLRVCDYANTRWPVSG